MLEDLSVKLHDLLVQKVNMDQMLSDQEAMVVPHASGQGLFQRGAFAAHPALRQLCQCRSIAVTIHNRFEHCSSRNPYDIGRHAGKFQVRPLQHLVQAVDHGRAFPDQIGALPSQIPQVALWQWRNEAPTQQAMRQQFSKPVRILDIGLAPRHLFHVLSIHDEDDEARFQQIVEWLPELAGALQATCVISRLVNQADRASRSAVMVLNVRVSLRG